MQRSAVERDLEKALVQQREFRDGDLSAAARRHFRADALDADRNADDVVDAQRDFADGNRGRAGHKQQQCGSTSQRQERIAKWNQTCLPTI